MCVVEDRRRAILTADRVRIKHAPEVGREINCTSKMNIVDRTTKRRTGLFWHLRRCLSWISDGDLFGVEEIVLEDRLGAATDTSPDWHDAIEGRNLAVGGQYFRRYGNEPVDCAVHGQCLSWDT